MAQDLQLSTLGSAILSRCLLSTQESRDRL